LAGTGCCCAKAGKATATSAVAIKVLRIDFPFLWTVGAVHRWYKTMRGSNHRSLRLRTMSTNADARRVNATPLKHHHFDG
jgi:hypothetical protein